MSAAPAEGKGGGSKNQVGPVIKSGDLAEAVAEAAREDNPGREVVVEDHSGYLRIKVEQECLLRRTTIERCLGRSFELSELQVGLAAIAGQMEADEERMRFYYVKTL